MSYIIPAFVVFTVFYGIYKKEKVFSLFCDGVKTGLNTTLNIFPSILGLVIGVGMLRASGFFEIFSSLLTPVCDFFNFPPEILPMAILRPMSGSGSFSLLNNIFEATGINSFPSLCASVMSGATETTFYTLAVYYGAVGITKTRHNIFCSISADILSFILSVVTVTILF